MRNARTRGLRPPILGIPKQWKSLELRDECGPIHCTSGLPFVKHTGQRQGCLALLPYQFYRDDGHSSRTLTKGSRHTSVLPSSTVVVRPLTRYGVSSAHPTPSGCRVLPVSRGRQEH